MSSITQSLALSGRGSTRNGQYTRRTSTTAASFPLAGPAPEMGPAKYLASIGYVPGVSETRGMPKEQRARVKAALAALRGGSSTP